MNWTGGRLYRHSNNSQNAVHKNRQKDSQRFRSSITKDSNWVPFSKLPSSMAANKPTEDQTHKPRGSDLIQASSARPSHLQPPQNGHTPFKSSQQSQSVSRLDRIKHQLLNTKDWAAVAVAKPLEVEFTQTEEIERFGKRRKLTEADRKRLADTENYVSWTELPFGKTNGGRKTPSKMRYIKDVTIKINGRIVEAEGLPAARNNLMINASSQSMLLDHEGSAYSRRSETARLSSPRHAEGKYSEHGPVESNLPSRSPLYPVPPDESEEREPGSRNASLDVVETTSVNEGLPTIEPRPSSFIQNNTANECQIVPSRRFTIDDQLDQMIAENERRQNAASRATRLIHEPNQERQQRFYHDSILSPKTLKGLDCFSLKAAHVQQIPWSPRATYNDGVSEPFYDVHGIMRNKSGHEERKCISSQDEPCEADIDQLPTGSNDTYTSPTKIFGQPVILSNNDNVCPMQPMWNQDPGTVTPNGSSRDIEGSGKASAQSKSPRLNTMVLQDASSPDHIMFRTRRPSYKYNRTSLLDSAETMFCSPRTLLRGSGRY